MLAIGSMLDPRRYDVRIIDGRLEANPVDAVLAEIGDALCLGVTVLTGAPIADANASSSTTGISGQGSIRCGVRWRGSRVSVPAWTSLPVEKAIVDRLAPAPRLS